MFNLSFSIGLISITFFSGFFIENIRFDLEIDLSEDNQPISAETFLYEFKN